MPTGIRKHQLQKQWVHSREESAGDRIVFRTPDYPFPPARGRSSLTLASRGALEVRQPGADDRTVGAEGRWELTDDTLKIDAPNWLGTYQVESIDPKMLVLKKLR